MSSLVCDYNLILFVCVLHTLSLPLEVGTMFSSFVLIHSKVFFLISSSLVTGFSVCQRLLFSSDIYVHFGWLLDMYYQFYSAQQPSVLKTAERAKKGVPSKL